MRLLCPLSLFAWLSLAACAAPPAPRGAARATSRASGYVAVSFRNEMGRAFGLRTVQLRLDGAPLFDQTAPSDPYETFLEGDAILPAFSGMIPEGEHLLEVRLLYKSRSTKYGIFSYVRAYKFEVRSSHSFQVERTKPLDVAVIAYEKGGVTTPLEERPAVRFASLPFAGPPR